MSNEEKERIKDQSKSIAEIILKEEDFELFGDLLNELDGIT